MGQLFPQQHEVAGSKRRNVIPDEPGASACEEKRQFHFHMVVPMIAFACRTCNRTRRMEDFDLAQAARPAEHPKRVAARKMDLFASAAHSR